MSWSKEATHIVEFVIVIIFGFGIALYLGSTLQGALPAGSPANTAVNNIINGVNAGITNVLVPIIAIVFILFLYVLVRRTGLLGNLGSKRD